jgi:ADP-heptose:LPS heptosyltransferase
MRTHSPESQAGPSTVDADAARICDSVSALLAGEPAVWSRPMVRQAVDVLCNIATDPRDSFANLGQAAIFSIVERLSDSFEPGYIEIYDEIFAQIVAFCSRCSGGEDLQRMLDRFQVSSESDLLARKKRLALRASTSLPASQHGSVRKIFVLSRVTLGADVAVTSVVVRCLLASFPNAEVVLNGPASLREVYRTVDRLRTVRVDYKKGARLMDRLRSWISLVRAIDSEREGLAPQEYIVVDPDSRLTQLGLLPVTEDQDRYFFFESRSYRRAGIGSLGRLAAHWCNDAFASRPDAMPFVSLAPEDSAMGAQFGRSFRNGRTARVVAVNFGVGENARKRISLEFETQLVLRLLQKGYLVTLDKGIGAEVAAANHIVNRARAVGTNVAELCAGSPLGASAAELTTWEGSAGSFAGLVASSDLYVGYDSAFQHIAAALGVPAIDIFAHAERETFLDRWTPYSEAPVNVIRVDPTVSASSDAISPVVSEILSSIESAVIPPSARQ